MSDIPREQPIRDSLEAIEGRSSRIRRMQRIIDALRPDVESAIEVMFGRTFFLNNPTAARLKTWRNKARNAPRGMRATAMPPMATPVRRTSSKRLRHLPRQDPELRGHRFDTLRQSLWG